MKIEELRRKAFEDIELGADLGHEIVVQPAQYLYYSDQLASAIRRRDACKRAVEFVMARKERAVREGVVTHTMGKLTEGGVSVLVREDAEVRKLQLRLARANHLVKLLDGVVWAFEQRKKMLEKLVDLQLHGLASEPSEDGTMSHQRNIGAVPHPDAANLARSAKDAVAQRMRRRLRDKTVNEAEKVAETEQQAKNGDKPARRR